MHVVSPRGHAQVVERLWRASREGRLPHALLFEGPEGIGKFAAARWFASGLLCAAGPDTPCGTCGPCKRVRSGGPQGNHPDLFSIDPVEEGEERIRVHRIARRPDAPGNADPEHCVEVFLDLRPMEGRGRVVLVRESHRMNVAAQNALLKTLEEPRPGTVLVLETDRAELLLPTIRSRCVRIRLATLSSADCLAVLAEQGMVGEEAASLARWAEGSPGRALALAARRVADFHAILSAVMRGERPALEAAAALWEVEASFRGPTPTARARERARMVLDLALALERDRMRLAAGLDPDVLAHGDLALELATTGPAVDPGQALEALLVCRGDIERNLAPEAVCERALLALVESGPILSGR